jgi:fibronectin-binding autotransporter adhesin
LYWDADGAGANLGGTGNWDLATPLWRFGSSSGTLQTWSNNVNNDAYLTGTGGTLTLTTGISVNDIIAAPSSGNYVIASASNQVLTLDGSLAPVLTVNAGANLTISATIAGTSGFTKSGTGTLVLSGTSNSLSGGISVTGGVLQTSGSTAASPLRANELTLGSGTSFTHSGTGAEVRLGALSGSGSFNPGSANTASILALSNQNLPGPSLLEG